MIPCDATTQRSGVHPATELPPQPGQPARRTVLGLAAALCLILFSAACRSEPEEVIVYTALDMEFSKPIFDEFTRQTGVTVRAKYDTETTKTVGLTEAILAERARPRCDLFWNNEILNTLRLQREGLLRPIHPTAAKAYPASARSPDGLWHGFAARARVLIVNTNRVAEPRWPKSILDLTDIQWRDRVGIAKPLAGTTASHAACLFAHWGDEKAKEFFRDVKANASVMAGNKQVAQAVAAGRLDFGITDTDDAMIELESGMPVTIIYPDQGEGQMGTLFIPNTLAVVQGTPNTAAAERLVEFLLSPQVEGTLAAGQSAQIPLNRAVDVPLRVETPQTIRAMDIDFQAAADKWETAAKFLTQEFTAP